MQLGIHVLFKEFLLCVCGGGGNNGRSICILPRNGTGASSLTAVCSFGGAAQQTQG